MLLKKAAEIKAVLNTAKGCDLRNGMIRVFQQTLGGLQSQHGVILLRRLSGGVFKQPDKIIAAESAKLCQFLVGAPCADIPVHSQ